MDPFVTTTRAFVFLTNPPWFYFWAGLMAGGGAFIGWKGTSLLFRALGDAVEWATRKRIEQIRKRQ